MRIGRIALLSLGLVSIFAAKPAAAQKFQEPTKEELQMTADPKAPGAPAVVLYREQSTDNFSHFVSEYVRIKVLTELGKEWATVEVPYRGGGIPPVIEGRTIHADGTVIPLAGKGEDLLITKSVRGHLNARVFNLPSVEVGSILEYRWTVPISGNGVIGGATSDRQEFYQSALAGSIPYWNVQEEIPIRKEKFYWNPKGDLERNVIGNQSVIHYTSDGELASYLLYSARLPAGAKVQVSPKEDYTLEVQDVPAFRHEPDAPPETMRRYGVSFYYTPYLAPDVYWSDEGKRWAKDIDHAAEPTDDLKTAAAQITAGATTDEEKARKLYDAALALNNTAFSRELSDSERAQLRLKRTGSSAAQIWTQKSGTRNEIATLYLALARAAGLQASPMLIADRSQRIFDTGYLSLDQLTVLLVVLRMNGADVFTDPGEKLMPFGQLRWSHMLCGGLLETAAGVSHAAVTPPNNTKDAITAHTADLTVDTQGGVTGTVKMLMNGPAALQWRQTALTSDAAEAQRQLREALQRALPAGLHADVTGVQALETSAGFLSVTAKVAGTLGTVTGKRVLLPAFLFSMAGKDQLLAEENREAAVDLHFAEQTIDDVVYHLPAGFTVESAPQPAQLPWPDHAALVVKTQPGAGTIDIKHIYARAFVILDAKEYPALRDYAQKMAVNDQQQVVLAAGN